MDPSYFGAPMGIPEPVARLENEGVRNRLAFVFQLAVAVVFGALMAILLFQKVTIQENSMEPTIAIGDIYFMNQVIYHFKEPQRGDVIVFRTNGSDEAALHISRIIGLPGETVRISNGRIYINEVLYQENASFPVINNPGLAANGITMEEEEYFVLGDNRNNSDDSRYSDIGKVRGKYIVGKLWFQIYPEEKRGFA